MDAIRETLEQAVAVALRSLRRPQTGLAAILAGLARDADAAFAVAYAVPPEPGEPEMLASAGRDAGALGPPGPAPPELVRFLRDGARLSASAEMEPPRGLPHPWNEHGRLLCVPSRLPGGAVALFFLGGARSSGSEGFRAASGAAALLVGALLSARHAELLRRELHSIRQERALLAAGLQHDLRTPLTSILGCAQTLRERGEALSDEHRGEMLDMVVSQAERLNEMVTEAVARHATGPDAPIRFAESDPRELAHRVARAGTAARGGHVRVEVIEAPLATDEQRLERALLNLVDNALKYSPSNETVHLAGETAGDTYVFTVADMGPGVASEVGPSLFTPYARDPNREESIGLGLHSVATLVHEMGGRVSYARRDGWTRFAITLPLDPRSSLESAGHMEIEA